MPLSTKLRMNSRLRGVIVPTVLLMVMLVLSSIGDFRAQGETRLDDASNRAIAAFAVARTLNGVISVIQEMQVGISLGISTTLQPGQILDPLNDLIERFSTAALIAATLLWSLKLMGNFIVVPGIPLLLLVLLAVRVSLDRCAACADVNQLLMRALRVGIVIWAFAALTPWVIDSVHSSDVIQTHYRHATLEMETAGQQLRDLADMESPWDISKERITQGMDQLMTMADRLSTQAIIVLAVFVFEVLVVPLGIFWISTRILLNPALNDRLVSLSRSGRGE